MKKNKNPMLKYFAAACLLIAANNLNGNNPAGLQAAGVGKSGMAENILSGFNSNSRLSKTCQRSGPPEARPDELTGDFRVGNLNSMIITSSCQIIFFLFLNCYSKRKRAMQKCNPPAIE